MYIRDHWKVSRKRKVTFMVQKFIWSIDSELQVVHMILSSHSNFKVVWILAVSLSQELHLFRSMWVKEGWTGSEMIWLFWNSVVDSLALTIFKACQHWEIWVQEQRPWSKLTPQAHKYGMRVMLALVSTMRCHPLHVLVS